MEVMFKKSLQFSLKQFSKRIFKIYHSSANVKIYTISLPLPLSIKLRNFVISYASDRVQCHKRGVGFKSLKPSIKFFLGGKHKNVYYFLTLKMLTKIGYLFFLLIFSTFTTLLLLHFLVIQSEQKKKKIIIKLFFRLNYKIVNFGHFTHSTPTPVVLLKRGYLYLLPINAFRSVRKVDNIKLCKCLGDITLYNIIIINITYAGTWTLVTKLRSTDVI